MGLDFEAILRDRPEQLDREDVLSTPAGGYVGGDQSRLPPNMREPQQVVLHGKNARELRYVRWQWNGDVTYLREDLALDLLR